MVTMSVQAQGFKEAERLLQGIKGAFPRIAAKAINYGLRAGRTAATVAIRKRYDIKSSVLKEQALRINKATSTTMEGALEAKGTMLPISLFVKSKTPKFKQFGKRKYQVVYATVVKGKRKLVQGAFMAKDRIWERRGEARDAPLGIVSTIGVPSMIKQLDISKQVTDRIAKSTTEELRRATIRELQKGKK